MAPLPLRRLLSGDAAGTGPVALGPEPRTREAFLAACAGAAAQLPPGPRVVLACEDAWDFAAGLFGLLRAGRTVLLPPNFLPGTLERLAREADAVLDRLPAPGAWRPVEALSGQVEFWTSGSTGEPKRVPRTLAQLDAEVDMLERTFGASLGPGPVVGTVPHQHIYGCLFRLLWPLHAGRPFRIQPCGDPSSFQEALGPGAAVILVSSPAHLSRLPRLVDLEALAGRIDAVFSSGGPLDPCDALAWRPWSVVEVYGSTETGGIAWRRQGEDPASREWTPMGDVRLEFQPDGALSVASFRAGPDPVRMEDAAAPAREGRFRLLGRLDRVVKVSEKRISLPEVEAALEGHPWVDRAALVLLPGPRPCLGAVVVLSPRAPAGRPEWIRALRSHLARAFEPAALPRRWRAVDELPRDDRGKLTAQALAGLFGSAP